MPDTEEGAAGPILVPVDFSPHSGAALMWAAQQARHVSAPLLLVHVAHDRPDDPGYYVDAQLETDSERGRSLRTIEEAADLLLDRFFEEMKVLHPELREVRVEKLVVNGVPSTRILELAAKYDVRQIVMGSHGRTGFSRSLLGSKAEEVVRLSPRPVTVVKADVGEDD